MLNIRTSNRFTSVLIAVVLLVSLSLATAAPAAAAVTGPAAVDAKTDGGPLWSGLIDWNLSEWAGRVFDWVGGLWAASAYTLDPDGQAAAALPPDRAYTPSRALSHGQREIRAFR